MGSPASNARGSQSDYARHRDVTKQRINALVSSGVIPLTDGTIDFAEADRILDETFSQARTHANTEKKQLPPQTPLPAGAKQPDGEINTYQVAKTLREKYAAMNERADYETRIGTLVKAVDVRREAAKLAREARVALQSIAARIGPLVAAEPDVSRCILIIDEEIRRVCERLAGGDA